MLYIGMYYITGAFLINLFVVKLILFKASYDKANRKKLLKTIGLMLLNIPIAAFYCWVVVMALNTLRIKFTNQTTATVTEIKIEGCQQKYIPKLKQGESKTLWIRIKGDCHVKMEYLANGERKTATVVGYTTNLQGRKMEYIINDNSGKN